MKSKFVLSFIVLFLLSLPISAQIPNAGFETWSNGSPTSWFTNNIPTVMNFITQSTTAHSGSYAAKGEVGSFMTSLASPLLYSSSGSSGFPIDHRFATISGYYKLVSQSGDKFAVNCILYKGSQPIAVGAAELEAASNYTQFSVPISYAESSTVPDNCILQLLIIGPTSDSDIHLGSYYLVDDLSLSGTATSVSDGNSMPNEFSLKQNYPNPFNPTTTISYSIPNESFVELKIFNMIGREVSTLVSKKQNAGDYKVQFNASSLPSGMYIYTIKAGEFSHSKKLMLMK